MGISKRLGFLVIVIAQFFVLTGVLADEVDSFISKIKTVTYDCPDPEYFPQLEAYLATDSLSVSQRFALSVEKSHYLLCVGKADEAHELLFEQVEQAGVEQSSYFYASAIYQIGFAYDFKEQPERCEFYQEAQTLAQDRHNDVFLSASLGIITNCMQGADVAQRLDKMFSILQLYSTSGNYQALAHIHNSIGLVYGELGQHVLAAEQYLKAHEMGLMVYTGSNQLTILISAITSLFASGQFDKAYESILEFEEINRDVGTPLTNYFYYFALSGYYYRTERIEEMKRVLPDLAEAVDKVSNPLYTAMLKWYQVVPCVHENDLVCIQGYLDEIEQSGKPVPRAMTNNIDYLKLQVQLHLAVGDAENVAKTFAQYTSRMADRRQRQQYSASILSVANLYNKIYELETEVERAEQVKRNVVMTVLFVALLIIGLVIYIMRKRQLERLSIDPVTQLLNSETAIAKIGKIDAPDEGKTNALAIFDLSNFREINRKLGATKGDFVLRQISQTLKNVTRDTDILGRFAPEQFILCLHNIEEKSAKNFFDRVQNELDNTFKSENDNAQINVRSSMSIFIATEKLSDIKSVLDEMLMSISIKTRH